jgi:hypothetical protein
MADAAPMADWPTLRASISPGTGSVIVGCWLMPPLRAPGPLRRRFGLSLALGPLRDAMPSTCAGALR